MSQQINKKQIWKNNRRQKLIEEYGGMCNQCGSKSELQFAHRLPTGLSGSGRGYTQRLYDVINHPASYILLCVECHKAFDNSEEK